MQATPRYRRRHRRHRLDPLRSYPHCLHALSLRCQLIPDSRRVQVSPVSTSTAVWAAPSPRVRRRSSSARASSRRAAAASSSGTEPSNKPTIEWHGGAASGLSSLGARKLARRRDGALRQRRPALILSSASDPGHRSCSDRELSGAATVSRWSCRSSGARSR
jgi:hypothetical protein